MTELNIEKRIAEIRQMYAEIGETNFSALIMGEFGSGKTSLLATAPKPILIDAFDPRCHIVLRDHIERGEVYLRPFWNEHTKRPVAYNKWERMWEKDLASGFFSNFGTYAIDSITTMLESMSNEVSKRQGRPQGTLAIQDYNIIYNNVRDIVKMTSSMADCIFLMTAHLVTEKDDVTNEVVAEIDTYRRLKSRLPLLFTEKYVMYNKPGSEGVKYLLLTAPMTRYRASTQLGKDGRFKRQEEPDICALMKKAGMEVKHKPLFK